MTAANGPASPCTGDEVSRFRIGITVPRADEAHNDVLLSRWRDQADPLTPPPPMTLPRRSEGSYRVSIWHRRVNDIIVEDQYSDAVAGVSGGPDGHQDGRLKVLVTNTGTWKFSSRRRTHTVGAGLICVRNNDEPWDFEVGRGTRSTAASIPIRDLRLPGNGQAVVAEQDRPAARLLLAHLRAWTAQSEPLGAAASEAARNAAVELFRGLLKDRVVDDESLSSALVRAATDCIESRLLTDGDLDPRAIAETLHVSVRSLHRAFTREATSVMGYVRERRLARARTEVISSAYTVSEIAARWHFADSSHFIRAYKKRFGETPAVQRLRT